MSASRRVAKSPLPWRGADPATDADIAAAGLALASGAMTRERLLDWILARR